MITARRLTVTVNKTNVECSDVEHVGWGFHFFTETELDAYKAAYAYRNSPHGVKVEFAGGVRRWMVTVFNARAKEIGVDV